MQKCVEMAGRCTPRSRICLSVKLMPVLGVLRLTSFQVPCWNMSASPAHTPTSMTKAARQLPPSTPSSSVRTLCSAMFSVCA